MSLASATQQQTLNDDDYNNDVSNNTGDDEPPPISIVGDVNPLPPILDPSSTTPLPPVARPLPTTLPLQNVIVITSPGDETDEGHNAGSGGDQLQQQPSEHTPAGSHSGASSTSTSNKTKKFYESDADTFIQAIFSQTITSTTVTPTDDEVAISSSSADQQPLYEDITPVSDDDDDGINRPSSSHQLQLYEDITPVSDEELLPADVQSQQLTVTIAAIGHHTPTTAATTPTNLSQHGGDVSQLTEGTEETFDGYQEAMISFTDVLGLEHDDDGDGGGGDGDVGGDGLGMTATAEAERRQAATQKTCENGGGDVWQRNGGGGLQGPLAVSDDEQASYFDRTIEEDEDGVGLGLEVEEEEEEEEEVSAEEDEDEDEVVVVVKPVNDDVSDESGIKKNMMESSLSLQQQQQLESTTNSISSTTTSSSSTTKTTTKKVVKKKKSITSTLSVESAGGSAETTTTITTNGDGGEVVTKKVKKLVKKKSLESSTSSSSSAEKEVQQQQQSSTTTTSVLSSNGSSNSTITEAATASSGLVLVTHEEIALLAAANDVSVAAAAVDKPKKKTKKTKKSDQASKENISVLHAHIVTAVRSVSQTPPQTPYEVRPHCAPVAVAATTTQSPGSPFLRKSTQSTTVTATTLPRSARYAASTYHHLQQQQQQHLLGKTGVHHAQKCPQTTTASHVPRIVPSGMQVYEDDLSNIDVKSLKKLYLPGSSLKKKTSVVNGQSLSSATSVCPAAATAMSLPAVADQLQQRHFVSREVSVKHLCRSFGDLTALSDATTTLERNGEAGASLANGTVYGSAAVPRPATASNIHRDSYCNLIGMFESGSTAAGLLLGNNGCGKTASSEDSKGKYSRVKFGIKQFDMKSSFSKFDALQKKSSNAVLHVRSSDAGKAQEKFSGLGGEPEKNCRACAKPVFKMEEVKAERNIWHRTCFKCSECAKQLNVDTYESHESILYCKPHFRSLFTPKAVEDNDPIKPRKPELIIRENQPLELPPDVVRSSDKADLGLDELHQLDVKSRFQAFELGAVHNTHTDTQADANHAATAEELLRLKGVRRSASVSSKLARFQARLAINGGASAGADDDDNEDNEDGSDGSAPEDDGRDSADEAAATGEDIDLVRAKRAQRERPLSFANMSEVRSRFEAGAEQQRDERREECKQELQNIRSRLFRGQQAKIKERYQQAVEKSDQGMRSVDRRATDAELGGEVAEKTRSIKDRFEKGCAYGAEDGEEGASHAGGPHEEEMAVFEQGLGKQSRSIFMEMDANAAKTPVMQSPQPQTPRTPETRSRNVVQTYLDDVVRAADRPEDVRIETADISNKFKFFESYKPAAGEKKQFRITPPRDGVVKLPSPDRDEDEEDDEDYDEDGSGNGAHGNGFVTASNGNNGVAGDGSSSVPNGRSNGNSDKVVRSNSTRQQKQRDPIMLQNSSTTTKMLSMFRQMEEGRNEQQHYDGMKPLKCFTPPPDNNRRRLRTGNSESENDCTDSEEEEDEEDDEEEAEEEEEGVGNLHPANGDYVRSSDKNVDEFLLQAKNEARAKQLRAKFERWETREIAREQEQLQNGGSAALLLEHSVNSGGCGDQGDDQSQVETAKEIRAKFESMRNQPTFADAREKIKVNRFL